MLKNAYIHLHNYDVLLLKYPRLDSDLCVKVCDYGLSRELYEKYYETDAKNVPYKWLAPESLTDGKYSSKSDVVISAY